ncbi:MAG: Molybdopterin molybdenumtransferase [candidate division WS2 bacterium]|nr:Molybdopterin molybdenumtransferase [Candidatus Psychracetigena formicireducens]
MKNKPSSTYAYLEEALKTWFEEVRLPLEAEAIPIEQSLGRITVEPVKAKISNPFYLQSALDGIAVSASSTMGARESYPIKLKQKVEAIQVNTGDPIPAGMDTVIPVEHILSQSENYFEINKSVNSGEGIRQIGEDIFESQVVVNTRELIKPQHIGLLAQAGIKEIAVLKKLKVGIIPTGDEVVSHTKESFKVGEIIDSNTPMLEALINSWGGTPIKYPPLPNKEAELSKGVEKALQEIDILLLIAGSSKGLKDLVPEVLNSLGKLLIKGVAIKPGRPVALALVQNKPVINIPGYPVSAFIVSYLFLKPLLDSYNNGKCSVSPIIKAILARKVFKEVGVREFLRVALSYRNKQDTFFAYPLPRGAGVLSSLVLADGLVEIPENSEGLVEGEEVQVNMINQEYNSVLLKGNTVISGSQDLALEILNTYLRRESPELTLKLLSVGSLSGLNMFSRGLSDICGMHVLDEKTGDYNYHLLKELKVKSVLVNLTYREQGFLIKKSNPKNIREIKDLIRDDIRFVNRQRGAGTRILLDYLLNKEGISSEHINGYSEEEFTHFGVAQRVKENQAEVGLGIKAIANIYNLDFITLHKERYDLLMTEEFMNTKKGQLILKILQSSSFKEEIMTLGGYDTRKMGEVIWKSV